MEETVVEIGLKDMHEILRVKRWQGGNYRNKDNIKFQDEKFGNCLIQDIQYMWEWSTEVWDESRLETIVEDLMSTRESNS